MKYSPIYDQDLRRARSWAVILGLCNAVAVAVHVHHRNWWVAAGAAVWVIGCGLFYGIVRIQQRTRDMGRVIEAGMNAMRHEIETGEL
jgi:hypothetical protein